MGLFEFLGFYKGPWLVEERTGKRTKVGESIMIGSDRSACGLWIPNEPEIKPVHAIVARIGDRYVLGCKDNGAVIYYNPEERGWSGLQSDKIYATLGKKAEIQLGGYRTDLAERRFGENVIKHAKEKFGQDLTKQQDEEPRKGYMLRFEL